MDFRKLKNVTLMVFFLVVIAFAAAYFFVRADNIRETRHFLNLLQIGLESGEPEINLSDITPFQWDHVEILIDEAPSYFTEGIEIESVLKENGIEYQHSNIIYAPSLAEILGLDETYKMVFLFINDGRLSKIYWVTDFTVVMNDTSYYFRNIKSDASNKKYEINSIFFKVENKSDASLLLKEKLGINYTADLVFFRK